MKQESRIDLLKTEDLPMCLLEVMFRPVSKSIGLG